MKYSVLASAYEELEKHPSRLKKTEIIADLLKKTPDDLLQEVVLLLTGKVFPQWSENKTGIAAQSVIKAISKSCGIDAKEVVKSFNKTGDLGKTVEHFMKNKKQKSLISKKITVDLVFNNIQNLSKQEGKGSQDRKINLISELLSSASPIESRYIVRTILEQLRVGIAAGTLRNSIVQAFIYNKDDISEKKKYMKIVEDAWFLNQDYGKIAEIAKNEGEEGLKKIKMEIGKPVAVMSGEKAPSLEDGLKKYENPALEYKYDGFRVIVEKKDDKFWLYTRSQENVAKQFPDLIDAFKKIKHDFIIEGECLAVDKKGNPLPFQTLSQRVRRKYHIEEMIKKIPIIFKAFDIVYLDGKNLFDKTFDERFNLLKKIITKNKVISLTDQIRTKDLKKAEKFYKNSLKAGQEGLMIKNLDAKYQPGKRVGQWTKVKPIMETLDLIITGGTWGTGKRTGWIGSFLLSCKSDDKYLECGRLGTGIKEKDSDVTFEKLTKMLKPLIEKEKGSEISFKPKIIIEVAYEEIQKSPTYGSGFALRFPRLVRIRWDKKDADTLERMENIYKMQKGKN